MGLMDTNATMSEGTMAQSMPPVAAPAPVTSGPATLPIEGQLPPAVAALGTPERVHLASGAYNWAFYLLAALFSFMALFFGFAAVKPFGQNPPPVAACLISFMVCGAIALGALFYTGHLSGVAWLMFRDALVRMRNGEPTIVPWDHILSATRLNRPGANYRVVTRHGQNFDIDGSIRDADELGRAIIRRVHGEAAAPETGPAGEAAKPAGKSNWMWPSITDRDSARQAALQGMWAAYWCAGITTAVALAGMAGLRALPVGAEALFDAAIFAAIGWGISRMSRCAAVAGLLLYVAERILMWQVNGPVGIFMAVAFTLCFIGAVRGTFAFHGYAEPVQPGFIPGPGDRMPGPADPLPGPGVWGQTPIPAAVAAPPIPLPFQPVEAAPSLEATTPEPAALAYDAVLPATTAAMGGVTLDTLRDDTDLRLLSYSDRMPAVAPRNDASRTLALVVAGVFVLFTVIAASLSAVTSHRIAPPVQDQLQRSNTTLQITPSQ